LEQILAHLPSLLLPAPLPLIAAIAEGREK
jgi:hypothetical protein